MKIILSTIVGSRLHGTATPESDFDYRGVFEAKGTRQLGNVTLVTKADHLYGAHLSEFKTTFNSFDAEKYLQSVQWRVMSLVFEPLELLVLAALATAIVSQMRGEWGRAFAANSVAIAATLATMAAGLYPWVLPARQGRPYGLSVHNAAAGHHGLAVALVWFTLAIVLALGYFVYTYRLLFRSPPA